MTPEQAFAIVAERMEDDEKLPAIFDDFELECMGAYYWTVRMGIKIGRA